MSSYNPECSAGKCDCLTSNYNHDEFLRLLSRIEKQKFRNESLGEYLEVVKNEWIIFP